MNKDEITRDLRRSALCAALGLCLSGVVYAQSNTNGSISGQAEAGDTVIVTNEATGFSREITTDANGNFRLSQLPIGTYIVKRGDESREVSVSIGTSSSVSFTAQQLDTIEVRARVINPIDVTSVESATVLSEAQIDRLPVPRDITNIALLAPGTTQGDSAFGNLASFGGASVAENVYYVNGFNVTNILTGTAFSELPFESVAEIQVKTGGYGAEFGRSLGGVVNIVTKRGTNDWKFGGSLYWEPGSLRENTPFIIDNEDGTYDLVEDNATDDDSLTYNLYGGGAIVQDRLFFFALFQGQKVERDLYGFNGNGQGNRNTSQDSPQGLVKLDWQISDNHLFELTAFRDLDNRSGTTAESNLGVITGGGGTTEREIGGDNYIARWNGRFTDTFSISALYGVGKYTRFSTNDKELCPFVVDVRIDATDSRPGCEVDATIPGPDNNDERTSLRLDGEWELGDHLLRFGVDREEFETVDSTSYSGGIYWRYLSTAPGRTLPNGGVVPDGVTEVVRLRFFENGGTFLTKNSAWYIEDNWQVTDNILAYIGLRSESFENLNSIGGTFVDISDTYAPRLGLSWDVFGDSSLKVFGNAGRYFIPVYANTNVRLAGGETDYQEFYTFSAIEPVTFAPTLGTEIGTRLVSSPGTVPDPRTVVDPNLDPLFQDEFILGFQKELGNNWSVGARGIKRDLKAGVDDYCSFEYPYQWALSEGYSDEQATAIGDATSNCFLMNPGRDLTANVDLDGTGELTAITVPASAVGLPQATRKYRAIEIFWEKAWDDKWSLQGSYTWSKSYGNTEGYVKSDNGQDDAGITQDFDYPGLTEGSYGYLPNDRRHQIKLFGTYVVNDEWALSSNLLMKSGRPINCFGVYPEDGLDPEAPAYGVASFYCNTGVEGVAYPAQLVPRGTAGRTEWTYQVDLSIAYKPIWADGRLKLQADIFNLFDSQRFTEVNENFEGEGREPTLRYRFPTTIQEPRYFRFSVNYEW